MNAVDLVLAEQSYHEKLVFFCAVVMGIQDKTEFTKIMNKLSLWQLVNEKVKASVKGNTGSVKEAMIVYGLEEFAQLWSDFDVFMSRFPQLTVFSIVPHLIQTVQDFSTTRSVLNAVGEKYTK